MGFVVMIYALAGGAVGALFGGVLGFLLGRAGKGNASSILGYLMMFLIGIGLGWFLGINW